MSDARLRELERRWKETGAAQDEAAWLLERLRVGQLSWDRVELAAELADSAAQLVLKKESGVAPPLRSNEALIDAVSRLGKEATARLCVPVARRVVDRWVPRFPPGRTEWFTPVLRALEAAEDWVLCPCEAHVKAAWKAATHIEDEVIPGVLSGPQHVWEPAYSAAFCVGDVEDPDHTPASWAKCVIESASRDLSHARAWNAAQAPEAGRHEAHVVVALRAAWAAAVGKSEPEAEDTRPQPAREIPAPVDNGAWPPRRAPPDLRSDSEVRDAISEELVPWLLETAEPIRERVAARSQAPD